MLPRFENSSFPGEVRSSKVLLGMDVVIASKLLAVRGNSFEACECLFLCPLHCLNLLKELVLSSWLSDLGALDFSLTLLVDSMSVASVVCDIAVEADGASPEFRLTSSRTSEGGVLPLMLASGDARDRCAGWMPSWALAGGGGAMVMGIGGFQASSSSYGLLWTRLPPLTMAGEANRSSELYSHAYNTHVSPVSCGCFMGPVLNSVTDPTAGIIDHGLDQQRQEESKDGEVWRTSS